MQGKFKLTKQASQTDERILKCIWVVEWLVLSITLVQYPCAEAHHGRLACNKKWNILLNVRCYCQIFSGFFVFPFKLLLVSFALLSYSICGFRRGCTCLRMIYKQRSLLSFVLVSIVERAQETFSVLVNVS